jgi:predicted alpha/beta superfamily hydrolase
MKAVLSILLALFTYLPASSQNLPNLSSGKIERVEKFNSKFVDPRTVDVWLPNDYSPNRKYDVVYMHDGQMLFDSSHSWNRQEWEVDETLSKLMNEEKIRPCIVVAIWNIPEKRFADYFPQKIIDSIAEPYKSQILTQQLKVKPNSDNYLKFIVTELKPFIDKKYSTNQSSENTFILGSSMGGLISVYAICEYPSVFGGAACLSIHSPIIMYELINENTDKEVASKFRNYLNQNLPKPNTKKIYFDYGSLTGDAFYKPYQAKIDEIMKQKGYDENHWQTKYFEGESHSESSWAKRLDVPLKFLLNR